MKTIEVKNLSAGYGNEEIINKISFSCYQGEKVGVIGPNGAGKSTLLKAVAGVLSRQKGSVNVMGQRIKKSSPLIAYLPQQLEIDWDFPADVFAVVLMGRYPYFSRGGPKAIDYQVVEESLAEVDLLDCKDRRINNLSGGQKQRVFIARALAQEAEILLFDEPFDGVDAKTENIIYNLLNQLAEEKTIIIVNHNLILAEKFFDRLILIKKELVISGSSNEVLQPDYLKQAYGKNFDFDRLVI